MHFPHHCRKGSYFWVRGMRRFREAVFSVSILAGAHSVVQEVHRWLPATQRKTSETASTAVYTLLAYAVQDAVGSMHGSAFAQHATLLTRSPPDIAQARMPSSALTCVFGQSSFVRCSFPTPPPFLCHRYSAPVLVRRVGGDY